MPKDFKALTQDFSDVSGENFLAFWKAIKDSRGNFSDCLGGTTPNRRFNRYINGAFTNGASRGK